MTTMPNGKLALLRQLHQQAEAIGHELTPTATLDTLDINECPVCEVLAALPHLLDIAEAARVECERSWSHSETPARRALREALNRLDQQP